VDPILTPILAGYLRFHLGEIGGTDYINYAVTKGDFDPRQNNLTLVVRNEHQGEIMIAAKLSKKVLNGNWASSTAGASGTMEVTKP
jgi:hypothetical protein